MTPLASCRLAALGAGLWRGTLDYPVRGAFTVEVSACAPDEMRCRIWRDGGRVHADAMLLPEIDGGERVMWGRAEVDGYPHGVRLSRAGVLALVDRVGVQ